MDRDKEYQDEQLEGYKTPEAQEAIDDKDQFLERLDEDDRAVISDTFEREPGAQEKAAREDGELPAM